MKFFFISIGTNQSKYLLKTNLTTMDQPTCNTTLLEFNKEANERSLRNGISLRQYCAWDPSGKNDACQGKQKFQFKMQNNFF